MINKYPIKTLPPETQKEVMEYISRIEESQQQDIKSVLNFLGGIKDEKARKIENFINEYLIKN